MTVQDKIGEINKQMNELADEYGKHSILLTYEKGDSIFVAISTDRNTKEIITRLQSALDEFKKKVAQASAISN